MARERNKGPLRTEEILRLFREIMSACLAQEEPLKVGYLGPEGTFSQTATLKHFGHSVRALALASVDEVFHEVEAGLADFGVVPVENSTEGSVNHTLDSLLGSPLKICGEVELRIHQFLMGGMDPLDKIKRICSHPQSLAQCRGWLDEHLPEVPRIPVSSNAEGARRARDEEGTAAIAGETAADVYGLKLLAAEIEDRDDNTTRFFVVGRKVFKPERRRPHHHPVFGAAHRFARRAVPAARTAGETQDQPDAHRVAAVAPQEMGLRVLLRHRGACRRAACRQGARRVEEARVAVPGAGLVSARGVLKMGTFLIC